MNATNGTQQDVRTVHKGSALKEVKILEFAWVIAGPLVGKYFADNGATVVRVESSKRLDMLRVSQPYKDGVPGVDRAGIYAFYNSNKRSMALDLKHPNASGVLERLIRWADIVTENFAPGKIEEMGLGYESIKKIKQDIIMARISIQGQTGPDCKHPGYGVLAAGLAGVTGLTGWPDRVPSTPVAGYTDVILPRFGATMILAALNYRRRTGKGQCIDLSQLESTQMFLAPALLDCAVNGRIAMRQGNSCIDAVPHNAYPCKGEDRWCVVGVYTDDQWDALCRVMGRNDLIGAEGFATFPDRKRHESEIDQLVQTWTIRLDAEDAVEKLQQGGVPAAVVENAADMVVDPRLSRSFWTLDHSVMGPTVHLGQAFTFEKSDDEPCTPSPCLGQDTEYVCREILGLSDEEFVELLSDGVFE
jgi:benzylsuccinate CoA-transferase BbsF subunit